ncbi:MAG TPA: GNAT family N-acetyltransferase [Oscillospiraceae bacterium]|nr:GNAT family N-acetyltransferase [Oscillospiraceae bacterium]
MNQFLEINGKKYGYATNYKDDDKIRGSFNALTKATYDFDFGQWYQKGYWKDQYIPYSLLDGDTVVANISVNIMDFLVMKEKKRYIQIGTVMTAEAYRKQGLSRALMEKILKEWENNCELIYLFANDTVLDFYPKFGFAPISEYQCSKSITKKQGKHDVRKLDMSDKKDEKLLVEAVSSAIPFSKITMLNNPSLVLFYCISFMKDSVYVIRDYDAVVIADYDEDTLYLHDVFCTKDIPLDTVIDALAHEKTEKVVLSFTPKDTSSFEMNLVKEQDTTLFVRSKNKQPFGFGNFMFPALSHA